MVSEYLESHEGVHVDLIGNPPDSMLVEITPELYPDGTWDAWFWMCDDRL